MARFNLDDYDTVESRLKKFWAKFPEGAIQTDNITTEGDRERKQWVVMAYIYRHRDDARASATGMAFETDGGTGPQSTSALEVCETSAIGRGLANFLFSGNKRASREEMEKVNRGNVTQLSRALQTTIDPASATTLDELNNLWSKAVEEGRTEELQAAFTARKKELS